MRPLCQPIWILLALCLLAVAPARAQNSQVEALREGNRLFREGRVEDAYTAYLAGQDDAAPHPVLSYNLGTTAHHLGRLPEAILWYRRAEASNPGDPWLRENLEMARDTLGLQPYPQRGLLGEISRFSRQLTFLAALIAWIGAAIWIARPLGRLTVPLSVLILGVGIYATILLAERRAPVAGVVTANCYTTAGDLPAGSEVWIVGGSTETIEVAAGGLTLLCPVDTVAPVRASR